MRAPALGDEPPDDSADSRVVGPPARSRPGPASLVAASAASSAAQTPIVPSANANATVDPSVRSIASAVTGE